MSYELVMFELCWSNVHVAPHGVIAINLISPGLGHDHGSTAVLAKDGRFTGTFDVFPKAQTIEFKTVQGKRKAQNA